MEKVEITSGNQFKEIMKQSEVYKLWSPEIQQQMLTGIDKCSMEQLLPILARFWSMEAEAEEAAEDIAIYDKVLAKKKAKQNLMLKEKNEQTKSEKLAMELLEQLKSIN